MTHEQAAKAVITRKKTIERERRRIKLGLPQLTKLHLVSSQKDSKDVCNTKYKLIKRCNYFSEFGSKVLYYDETTRRSRSSEERYKDIFQFIPAEGFNEADSVFKNYRNGRTKGK